jgi:hypothetical protein
LFLFFTGTYWAWLKGATAGYTNSHGLGLGLGEEYFAAELAEISVGDVLCCPVLLPAALAPSALQELCFCCCLMTEMLLLLLCDPFATDALCGTSCMLHTVRS